MSALPNFKASSFFRAARGCGALALAGAMVLPMAPALAQNVAADAPATAAAGSLPADPAPKALSPRRLTLSPRTGATTL